MSKFAPPRSDTPSVTDRGTLDFTIAVLSHYFDLSADGYLCQTPDLWRVLVTVAARRTYIETVCNDLHDAPDSHTVRGYLKAQLTPERSRLPKGLSRTKRYPWSAAREGLDPVAPKGAATCYRPRPPASALRRETRS